MPETERIAVSRFRISSFPLRSQKSGQRVAGWPLWLGQERGQSHRWGWRAGRSANASATSGTTTRALSRWFDRQFANSEVLRSLPQALHSAAKFEPKLLGFVLRQPVGHVREHDLPHPSVPLRPRHLLGRSRLVEQQVQPAADRLWVRQIALYRRLQPIFARPEQAALRRRVPEQINIVRHSPLAL